MQFRNCFFRLLGVALCLLAAFAFGQAERDPWLILAGGKSGAINAQTTRNDLVRMYGAANVVDQEVDVGEGEMQSATFLFPKNPERQIEILWKDPDTKTQPQSADIFLVNKSRWHGVYGIKLGTSAGELERLNDRPFHFALTNDGTDMAQQTFAWRGGRLEREFQGAGRIILELKWSPEKAAKSGPSDIEVDSDNLLWRAQNPRVSRISWIFPSNTNP